jgi:hypothetical protein
MFCHWIEPVQSPLRSRPPVIDGLVLPSEDVQEKRVRHMSRFTPGILIVLLVLPVACESSGPDNPFGFTIPEDIETTDGALDYVRERENMKPRELINNDEVKLCSPSATFGICVGSS